MEPHGLGALQLAFEQLKKKLQAEGLFDAARKRPLPALPRKIGIVTSLDGAALRDIIKVLRRRASERAPGDPPGARAGRGRGRRDRRDGAPRDRHASPGVDVIIVGRGGGSVEDLWAFNEERVARAIVDCPVPVISAVGHETDVTIADFVADLRAPTPSAAAEMVVAAKDEFCARIDRLRHRLRAPRRGAACSGAAVALQALTGRRGLAGWHGASGDARPARRRAHARAAHAHAPRSCRDAPRGTIACCVSALEQRDLAPPAGGRSAAALAAPTGG